MRKNKRALSEMVSYVLLIVIAIGLAAGVYAWMKAVIPAGDREKCSDEVSLIINDYSCDLINKKINISLQNKGNFNIDGFIIRASDNASKMPTTALDSYDPNPINRGGRYYFNNTFTSKSGPIAPGDIYALSFSYGALTNIKRIQIQPFLLGTKTQNLALCPRIEDLEIDC